MQIVRSFNINFEWFKRINLVMQVGHVLHVQVTSLSPRWFIDFNFNELESSRWGLNFHSGRLVRSISYWSLLSCFNIKITFIASVESNSSCSYSDCVWKPQSNLIPVTLMEFNIGASSSTRATRRRRGGGWREGGGGGRNMLWKLWTQLNLFEHLNRESGHAQSGSLFTPNPHRTVKERERKKDK